MDIKKLQASVIDALEDVKAQDIRIFDTVHLTSLFDRLAIASGTSNRQTKALAASVRDKVKENGGTIISIEGEETGEWVLVDLGDMVVHIMQPAIRAYYRLEEIWGDKEISLGAAKRTAKSSATKSASEGAAKKPAVKKTASKTAAKKPEKATIPRKTATKSATKSAAKSAAKKAAAPRKTASKTTASKSATAVKKAPAKRASKSS